MSESAAWEARGLHRLVSTGFTIEQIHALIAVPAKLECVLRAYAQANPRDACWIEGECASVRRPGYNFRPNE